MYKKNYWGNAIYYTTNSKLTEVSQPDNKTMILGLLVENTTSPMKFYFSKTRIIIFYGFIVNERCKNLRVAYILTLEPKPIKKFIVLYIFPNLEYIIRYDITKSGLIFTKLV